VPKCHLSPVVSCRTQSKRRLSRALTGVNGVDPVSIEAAPFGVAAIGHPRIGHVLWPR